MTRRQVQTRGLGAMALDAGRDGDWLPAGELLGLARAAAAENPDADVTINLDGIDHVDAGALQVLLALAAERSKRGKRLLVANASLELVQRFACAGASPYLLLR